MDMKTTEIFEEIKKDGYISKTHVAIFRKAFPFLTVDELRYRIRTNSYKEKKRIRILPTRFHELDGRKRQLSL